MKKLLNTIVLLCMVFKFTTPHKLPPAYQQKIDHGTNDIKEQHRIKQVQMISDFAKARQKFGNDWKQIADEAELEIQNIKNRVTEEYTTNRIESVKNTWNGHVNDITNARESDKFIDNYLNGGNQCISEKDSGAISSDQFLQSYLDQDAAVAFQKKFNAIKEAEESDLLLESYLLGN